MKKFLSYAMVIALLAIGSMGINAYSVGKNLDNSYTIHDYDNRITGEYTPGNILPWISLSASTATFVDDNPQNTTRSGWAFVGVTARNGETSFNQSMDMDTFNGHVTISTSVSGQDYASNVLHQGDISDASGNTLYEGTIVVQHNG